MKKLFFSVFTLTLFACTNSFAQSGQTQAAQPQAQQPAKVAMSPNDLPEAVKKTLANETYKTWQLVSAALIKGDKEYYELEMKKGEEATTLKIDAKGNVM